MELFTSETDKEYWFKNNIADNAMLLRNNHQIQISLIRNINYMK